MDQILILYTACSFQDMTFLHFLFSLEQRNEELQLEVVHLKTNLSQQRQWYQVVQAKIEESEKARAAAELRNATLQREMEQFFDTFGELNNEAKKTEYIVKSFWAVECLGVELLFSEVCSEECSQRSTGNENHWYPLY